MTKKENNVTVTKEPVTQKSLTMREILTSSGVPFWWQFDATVPSTDRERKKLLESLEESKKQVLAELDILKDARNALKRAMQQDAADFASQKSEQARLDKEKEELARYREEQAALEKENELLSKDRDLALARHDRELREIELATKTRQKNIQEEYEEREKRVRKKITAINKELKSEKARLDYVNGEIAALDARREELYPLRAKIQSYEGELFRGNYDALSEDNVLQILSVCLFDKESRRYVLNTPRIYVKRGGVTVISAPSDDLVYVSRLIKRTLPSFVNLRSGEILLEGENVTSMYREEYNKKFHGKIRFFDTFVESLHSDDNRPLSDVLKMKKCDDRQEEWLTVFGLSGQILSRKVSSLDEKTKHRLALAFLMSPEDGVSVFNNFKATVSPDLYERFVDAVNASAAATAVLLLTDDDSEAFGFVESKFYKL